MTWVDQELELPENKIYILYHTQKTNDIDNFNRKSQLFMYEIKQNHCIWSTFIICKLWPKHFEINNKFVLS